MANFSSPFLDEVLARTDVVEIIAHHVELKKSGANMMGLCPFHHEKSPSFSVSPDKQLYYCFGCGKGGGAFQFLMDHDGYAFPEAVEYLAEKAGLEVPQTTRADPDEQARHRQAQDMLCEASAAFARSLDSEPGRAARNYLKQRGFPEHIIRDYGLGYAPSGYGFMQKIFGEDEQALTRLEAVGLLFKGERGYGDRFRDRLMFTIRDRRGRVVGFGGRVLGDGEPKYLNSPETAWFHKSTLLYGFSEHRDVIRKQKQLLIVEGYMDVLALAESGLKIGLAPLGTAIGESQIREIFRLHEAPVFCFDGDRAGRQAAWRALDRMLPLLKAELTPTFLYLPDNEDPDSLLKLEGADAFKARMQQQPKPVLDTWLMGLELLAGAGADGRARMAKKADAMLSTMTDQYLQQAWRQEAERATGILLQPGRRRTAVKSALVATRSTAELTTVELRFLSALMQNNQRFLQLPDIAARFFIDNSRVKSLYSRAFSIKTDAKDNNTDIASQLIREFPDDQTMIARWVNQATVQNIEFESLVLDMEANHITRLLRRKSGSVGLSETIKLKKRFDEIGLQRRKLNELLNETGA